MYVPCSDTELGGEGERKSIGEILDDPGLGPGVKGASELVRPFDGIAFRSWVSVICDFPL